MRGVKVKDLTERAMRRAYTNQRSRARERLRGPPMTTLPATMIEAEAVDLARRHIAFARSGQLKLWGVVPGTWFEQGENQRASRLMMRELMLNDATILMDAVSFARTGYEWWEECLRELILEFQNRGAPMPTYLAAFAMDLTRGVVYSKKPGRRHSDDVVRDMIVVYLVGMVVERFNLRPRRNPASRRVCACSIVTKAMELEGIATSEWNVAQLWKIRPEFCKDRKWSEWLSA